MTAIRQKSPNGGLIRWDLVQVGAKEMEHLRPQFGLCSETMTVMCRLWITSRDSEDQFANVEDEAEVLKPAPNDFLQRWPGVEAGQ
jgi:hypothetical protein